jgi:hypothetical protein
MLDRGILERGGKRRATGQQVPSNCYGDSPMYARCGATWRRNSGAGRAMSLSGICLRSRHRAIVPNSEYVARRRMSGAAVQELDRRYRSASSDTAAPSFDAGLCVVTPTAGSEG